MERKNERVISGRNKMKWNKINKIKINKKRKTRYMEKNKYKKKGMYYDYINKILSPNLRLYFLLLRISGYIKKKEEKKHIILHSSNINGLVEGNWLNGEEWEK